MIANGKGYDKINRWLQNSKRYKNITSRDKNAAKIIDDYINDQLFNAGMENNRPIQ
nr:MAG TPA: hypothetical protein [Crassvirales sp.]